MRVTYNGVACEVLYVDLVDGWLRIRDPRDLCVYALSTAALAAGDEAHVNAGPKVMEEAPEE